MSHVTFRNKHLVLDVAAFLRSPEGKAQTAAIIKASERFLKPRYRATIGDAVRTRFGFPGKSKTKARGVVESRDGGYVYVRMNRGGYLAEFYDNELELY